MDRPGKFKVVAEIASEGQGRFEVSVGWQKVEGTAPKTDDFTKFCRANPKGTLEITNTGSHTLTVKPVAEGWQPMNLKSLLLQPGKP